MKVTVYTCDRCMDRLLVEDMVTWRSQQPPEVPNRLDLCANCNAEVLAYVFTPVEAVGDPL